MKFDIKEVLVSGDSVIVRGEVTGTPAGDLFGVPPQRQEFPHDGDRHSDRPRWQDRKTYHMENWLSALAASCAPSNQESSA